MNGQTKQTLHDIYIGTSFLFHISIMKLKIGILGPKVLDWCEYLKILIPKSYNESQDHGMLYRISSGFWYFYI